MKKRFWAIPLMAIAIACTVLLGACGGPSVEELIREDIDNAFGEFSSDNPEFMDAMLESADGSFEQMGIDPQEFADAYFKGFDHKVKDVVVDEKAGTAEATVTVKMKSLSAIMMDFANRNSRMRTSRDSTTRSRTSWWTRRPARPRPRSRSR